MRGDRKMKEKYEQASIEIVLFKSDDIITVSGYDEDETEHVGGN